MKKQNIQKPALGNNPNKVKAVQDIIMALRDIKEYEKGKKKLKSAREMLNQL